MKSLKTFILILPVWLVIATGVNAAQSVWEGTEPVLPDQVNPPWNFVTSGQVSAYRANDDSLVVAYLISTQAVDNVYYEQSGDTIAMTNQLVISAVMKIVSGAATTTNQGLAGITFTTAPNVGGALWFGPSNIFVSAVGDVCGGSTNLNTTTNYHTYRIEVQGTTNGGPYTVFYDGTAVLTGALYISATNFGALPRIQWGEISPTAYGESHWYNISHNAAAPAATPSLQNPCASTTGPVVPTVNAPFMNLTSEGRITNGTSYHYANYGLMFNSDNGVIYEGVQGGYQIMDAGARRVFTQSDGSQIMLFEFTDLTFAGINVKVTGSRAAAILATGDIQLINTKIIVDASGDSGPLGGASQAPGTNAPAPFGGGGGRGIAGSYSGGSPPYLTFGTLPTSGPGGGGFVSRGRDGLPAEPVELWKYNGPPTYDFTLLGHLYRPGGEGGAAYTNFSVLRGGGAGGSTSGQGFGNPGGFVGGHGGGALFLATPGRISLDSRSGISVDGQMMLSYLSEIAAGGAGGYLVLNGGSGILNQGSLSARGGGGRKNLYGTPLQIWWGSCGDGGGGLIVLKSAAGVTNNGALLFSGGDATSICSLGAMQTQSPVFINNLPQLLNPTVSSNKFTFSFNTAYNGLYEVQYNDDLTTTNWMFYTSLTGNGSLMQVVTPASGTTNRFFRLRQP
ncbi:MAG: hypothetical protein WDM80_02375 [Limisphaerales bacterium]